MNIPLRVLLVEDSVADAELELVELRLGGYDPDYERVDTPEELKAALEKREWDIILSDYVMPRFSGPAALRLVQERGLDVPFVMVTGQVGEATAIETLTAGAHDYVMKDNLARLVPAVQRMLQDAVLRRERREAEEALRRAHEDLRLAHAELERRVEERTRALATEQQRLAITLRSIGDAVITTDAQDKITLMNDVAEDLTGWTEEEAAGRPLAEVFRIINEESRVACENPIERVLETGAIVGLANNTVLIAKGGAERIIADSAAPVRGEDGATVGVVLVFRDVTERKQAEEALRQERDFAQSLIDTAQVIVLVLDAVGRIVRFNPYMESISGYRLGEVQGQDWFSTFLPERDRDRIRQVFLQAVSDIQTRGNVNPIVTKAGYERQIEWYDKTLKDANGKTVGMLAIGQDITERIRFEDERERLLRKVEARQVLLQAVIENAPVGIAVLRGPSFVFELVNPAYQAIAPGKVLVGSTVAESWPELAFQVVPLLEHVYHTGEPYRTVDSPYPVQRSPGGPIEEVYFTFAYIPLRRPDDQVDAILVLVIETTEQVHARQRIEQLARDAQRRSAELQSIIDNMADGVFVSDAESHITLVNGAGIKILGMGRPEEAKRMLEEFPELLRMRHPDGSPVGPEELPLGRALKGETVVQHDEIIFDHKTQRDTYLRSSAAPIRDGEGKIVGAVALTRDVTELMELDRLKDQFIEVAAHELKTPVTGIKGFAQFLLQREHEGVSPVGLRALEAINRQSDRISRLVNELLETSRIQTGRLEFHPARFDLSQLAAETVERMKIATEKHGLLFQSPGPVLVNADRERIGEVLRFSPQGGDIETTVGVVGEEAVVSVQDRGVGIPIGKQSRIFERFYRAHTGTPYDYGGMGVALFISKELVERHGGRMWFESEEGKGSTFYFSLPAA